MWVYEGRYLVINVPWVTLRLFGPVFFFFVVSCEGVLSGVDSWLVLGVPWLAFVLLFEVSSWRIVELESILIKKWYISLLEIRMWIMYGPPCGSDRLVPDQVSLHPTSLPFNPFLYSSPPPNQSMLVYTWDVSWCMVWSKPMSHLVIPRWWYRTSHFHHPLPHYPRSAERELTIRTSLTFLSITNLSHVAHADTDPNILDWPWE